MKTVLFVCVHNAARSQMAEAFFTEMTERRYQGISAGSQPADRVNPGAVKAMAEVGIEISNARPKRLTAEIVEKADIVVTMGCGENVCPVVPKEVIEWELEDPSGKPFETVREIRNQIREKVRQLIKTLDKDDNVLSGNENHDKQPTTSFLGVGLEKRERVSPASHVYDSD